MQISDDAENRLLAVPLSTVPTSHRDLQKELGLTLARRQVSSERLRTAGGREVCAWLLPWLTSPVLENRLGSIPKLFICTALLRRPQRFRMLYSLQEHQLTTIVLASECGEDDRNQVDGISAGYSLSKSGHLSLTRVCS